MLLFRAQPFVKPANAEGGVAGMGAEAAAAKDGDKVATLAKVIAGGQRASYCRSCHNSFRGKKKKKK